jgi:hypothetical protein
MPSRLTAIVRKRLLMVISCEFSSRSMQILLKVVNRLRRFLWLPNQYWRMMLHRYTRKNEGGIGYRLQPSLRGAPQHRNVCLGLAKVLSEFQ